MKATLFAMFVALLMVGCGEDSKKPPEDSLESNQTSTDIPTVKFSEVAEVGLDDPETLKGIMAQAIDRRKLKMTGKLYYAPNEQTPYTGWGKDMYDNGQIHRRWQYKDGKLDGLWTHYWRENGQKLQEINLKDGKNDGLATSWYKDGQKKEEGNWKNGKMDGPWTKWYKNGQKWEERIYKDGKLMSAITWKLNGEKCPETNVVDGNGVWVRYRDDGTEWRRDTYKGGKEVYD